MQSKRERCFFSTRHVFCI